MKKDFSAEFKKCPACGSDKRFFEELATELKLRGIARPEWNFSLDGKTGVLADVAKIQSIPIGAELPGYDYATDICMECGLIYATRIRRFSAKRTVDPAKTMPSLNIPFGKGQPGSN